MVRIAIVLAAVLLATHLSGSVTEAACAGDCPDDATNRDCAPDCDACACCVHPKSEVAIFVVGFIASPVVVGHGAEIPTIPPTVDPQEILHIPKRVA